MGKKILTLDSLYQFFVEQNKTVNFNSKESGEPIVVKTSGFFESADDDMPGMLKLKLKVCHTETNRNGSHISQENMEKAMPTLKYRPILAYIHTLPDGTEDFYAHNVEIVENEDGEAEISYAEKQVGCFTADEPWLEYDKEMDKTYVMAYAVIPEEYTSTADIIRRKDGTKVSCELVINELAYNAKEKYLDLTDFFFGGCTLLGCDEDGNEIGEGMLGSRADISDFYYKEPIFTYQDKLIEALEKLNFTLESFNNTNTQKKGGSDMDKFNELLTKYGVNAEDITFEIEGLSDEELEAKFAEAFDDDTDEETNTDENTNTDDTDVDDNQDDTDDGEDAGDSGEEKFTKIFTLELSHDDIRCALYSLISQYEEEDNEWYGIREVYDNYFIMQGWYNNKLYKISYSVDGENVSLEGERQEVFELIVSESEKLAIEKMREDYAALEAQYNELRDFKANIEAAELQAQKDTVFAKAEYECLADSEAFKTLKADAEKYSVEEIESRVKAIFADHIIATGTFSFVKKEEPNAMKFAIETTDNTNSKPYGTLFDD